MIQSESDLSDRSNLNFLKKAESGYYFNAATYGRALGGVGLASIHGPFGIGTTRLTNDVHRANNDMGPIPTITTRTRNPEDPATHVTAEDGISLEMITERVEQKSLINFHVNPEGIVYGTIPEAIPADAEYLVGPISFTSLETLQNAGFSSYNAIYITREGQSYDHHLREALKRPIKPEARFIESEQLIAFVEANLDESWVSIVELSDDPKLYAAAVDDVARIARQGSAPIIDTKRQRKLLHEMWFVLQRAKRDTL